VSNEELSRLWQKLNNFLPYDWEEDVKTMLDAIAELQIKYDLALRTAAILREQRNIALDALPDTEDEP
jgi:hypothetical protein